MSHKAGHIIVQSLPSNDTDTLVGLTSVELNFPSGMEIEDRIKQVRHAMKVMDKLDHPADED